MPSPETSESRPVLLGLPFDALTTAQALDRIFQFAAQGPGEEGCRSVATVNVDFIVNTWSPFRDRPRDPALAAILRRADLTVPDGMPLVWLSRLLGTPLPERVTGADLVPLIAERAAKDGRKLFFLGGTEEYTRQAAELLKKRHPGLEIELDCPFVRLDAPDAEEKDRALCGKINASGAAILLVGFGNPKQELWLERNRRRLNCGVAMGVGGTFNFIAGAVKRAPGWMQRSGTEWIYRIIQEPGRLWKRYCVGLFQFGLMALRALCSRPLPGGADFSPDETGKGLKVTGTKRLSPGALETLLKYGKERPVPVAKLTRRQMRQLRAGKLADLIDR